MVTWFTLLQPTRCPPPITEGTDYYVNVVDDDTFKLAPTYSDAIGGTNLIDITTAGAGIVELVSKPTRNPNQQQ